MQRRLISGTVVLRQMMGGGGRPAGSGGGGGGGGPSGPGGMPIPAVPPGRSMNLQHSMEHEADRKRKLAHTVNERYIVVREERTKATGRVIGIDLGTTNSCICYIDAETKKPKVIPSPTGSWVYPTAITFDRNHEIRLFGEEARACVRSSASATLCSGKRLIGRGFGELGKVQSEMNKTNVLTINEKGEVAVEVAGRTYTIVHIMAMFLRYLKCEAEKFLKEPVDIAVVSVPAYFTPQQKVATEDAALSAGFDVLEVIDEPSAACLTYTVLSENDTIGNISGVVLDDQGNKKRIKRSLVFDLGGGTLDCAIMEHDQYKQKFTLVATHGDPLLGGNDWDTIIMHHFAEQFEAKWKIPIEDADGNVGQGVSAFRNLTIEAEKAKVHFTHSTEPYYGYNRAFHFSEKLRDIVPLEATLSHEEYVMLTRPLRVRCLECITNLFEHTNLRPEDIDNVLLVGAMTRDPPIRHMLAEFFGKPPAAEDTCPADYSVAIGAAIRGGMLQGIYPELSASTQFVTGTLQNIKQGGYLRRAWGKLRYTVSPINPNAIGTRWRGKAKGLTDDEIAQYAKELVQFEAACARRMLLERAEDDANFVMRRVSADSNRKQGMQERRIVQLSEQLKFWQYMVHNFHDHEEELLKTVTELREALDELDGLASDDKGYLTEEGTIDFTKTVNTTMNRTHGRPDRENEEAAVAESEKALSDRAAAKAYRQKLLKISGGEGQEGEGEESKTGDASGPVVVDISEQLRAAGVCARPPVATAAEAAAAAKDAMLPSSTGGLPQPLGKGPKILRRTVPLPKMSVDAEDLIEAGHPALVNRDIHMSENTRASFLESQIDERAWREPPKPPGEEGSWQDVKVAMDSGEMAGAPVPLQELVRPMTLSEMEAALRSMAPVDEPPTAEHERLRDQAIALQTMTIVTGAVGMAAIDAAVSSDQVGREREVRDSTKQLREQGMDISARLHR